MVWPKRYVPTEELALEFDRLSHAIASSVVDLTRLRDDVTGKHGKEIGGIFDFRGAVEGECGRHEDQDRPFAFQRFVRHVDELAVEEGLGFEGLDLGIDQGHLDVFL